jgi:hypothetical protein
VALAAVALRNILRVDADRVAAWASDRLAFSQHVSKILRLFVPWPGHTHSQNSITRDNRSYRGLPRLRREKAAAAMWNMLGRLAAAAG